MHRLRIIGSISGSVLFNLCKSHAQINHQQEVSAKSLIIISVICARINWALTRLHGVLPQQICFVFIVLWKSWVALREEQDLLEKLDLELFEVQKSRLDLD